MKELNEEILRKCAKGLMFDMTDEQYDLIFKEFDVTLEQTLIGDRVDGYEGCKGIGDKTARKILGEIGENPIYVMWQSVIDAYKSKGYTEEDALRNAKDVVDNQIRLPKVVQ